jgi:hypothetical protein
MFYYLILEKVTTHPIAAFWCRPLERKNGAFLFIFALIIIG